MASNYQQEYIVDYVDMQDVEIVALVRTAIFWPREFLIVKYKNFVRSKARSYFLIGADREDIIQEGMIGLYKAILHWGQALLLPRLC